MIPGLRTHIDFNTVTENDIADAVGSVRSRNVDKFKPDGSLKYTDIASTLKSIADGILPFYGEDCCVKIFNYKW